MIFTMMKMRKRAGQAMVEYILVFAALFAVVTALTVFLYAARKSSNRTSALVSSEYP